MVSLRSLVAGVALFAATVFAAATPQQIADGLKLITQKSAALQETAQSITVLNAPLIVIGQGPFPTLIAGFQDIISTANTIINELPGTAPIQRDAGATRVLGAYRRDLVPRTAPVARGADADLIFDAFRELVRVMQTLLNILIGKAGIVEKVPVVGQPMASVLRGLESVIDTIAITLINLTQARAKDLTAEANSLDATMTLCIQSYDSISA